MNRLEQIGATIAGIAMIFTLSFAGATHVHAQSNADLQALIQALQQQVAQLQQQLNNRSGTQTQISGCAVNFTQDLTVGSRGSQVEQLQKFLNAIPAAQVARSGPGSPGQETAYFGPLTRQAVIEFQNAYAQQILAPLGLARGTGFWGPSSRSQANAICTQRRAQTQQGQQGQQNQSGDDTNDSQQDQDRLTGGEGAINNFETISPRTEEISDGEEKRVMGFQFEARGADMRVERIDFLFEAVTQTNGDEPWDYIESISLYRGNTRLATRSADDEDNWSDQGNRSNRGASGADEYRFRFSGLREIVREREDPRFYLEVEAQNNLDSSDLPQDFLISVAESGNSNSGIRAVDAAGINQYGGDASDTATLSFEAPDTGNLIVRRSPDDPNDRVVHVDATSDTDDVTALVFEVEARDQDIQIEDLMVRATTTGSDLRDIAQRFNLLRGNTRISSKIVPSSSGMVKTITFDNIDIDIDEDDEVEFTITVDLNDTNNQSRYQDGDTLAIAVRASDMSAEETTGDEDNLTASNLKGEAQGSTMRFRETAPMFDIRSTSASRGASDSQGDITSATYRIRFAVTADDNEDIYIPYYSKNNDVSIVASTTDGNGGVLSPEPSIAATIGRDGASDQGVVRRSNTWRIPAGRTGVFTLSLTADNEGASSDRYVAAKIESLKWNTSDSTSGLIDFTFDLDDWETEAVLLNN